MGAPRAKPSPAHPPPPVSGPGFHLGLGSPAHLLEPVPTHPGARPNDPRQEHPARAGAPEASASRFAASVSNLRPGIACCPGALSLIPMATIEARMVLACPVRGRRPLRVIRMSARRSASSDDARGRLTPSTDERATRGGWHAGAFRRARKTRSGAGDRASAPSASPLASSDADGAEPSTKVRRVRSESRPADPRELRVELQRRHGNRSPIRARHHTTDNRPARTGYIRARRPAWQSACHSYTAPSSVRPPVTRQLWRAAERHRCCASGRRT